MLGMLGKHKGKLGAGMDAIGAGAMTIAPWVGGFVIATGTGLVFWSLLDAYNDTRESKGLPRLKMEALHLILVGLGGTICSVLIMGVGVIWLLRQPQTLAASVQSTTSLQSDLDAIKSLEAVNASLTEQLAEEKAKPKVSGVAGAIGLMMPGAQANNVRSYGNVYSNSAPPAQPTPTAEPVLTKEQIRKQLKWLDDRQAFVIKKGIPTATDSRIREYVAQGPRSIASSEQRDLAVRDGRDVQGILRQFNREVISFMASRLGSWSDTPIAHPLETALEEYLKELENLADFSPEAMLKNHGLWSAHSKVIAEHDLFGRWPESNLNLIAQQRAERSVALQNAPGP